MKEEDPNVLELVKSCDGSEWGTLLRLAAEFESLDDAKLRGYPDLWEYLRSRGFSADFVEKVAKVYWFKACVLVEAMPYRHVVTTSMTSERRLAAHLLREVCRATSSGSGGAGGPPPPASSAGKSSVVVRTKGELADYVAGLPKVVEYVSSLEEDVPGSSEAFMVELVRLLAVGEGSPDFGEDWGAWIASSIDATLSEASEVVL